VDGSIEQLTATDMRVLNPGDVFVVETPGGGGFGAQGDIGKDAEDAQ
jgi:5-oxoprolinase (ATP-hydrolysing)